MAQRADAREAKAWLKDRIGSQRIVNGIGLARNNQDWIVKVNLRQEDDDLRQSIPAEVMGVRVVVEITGQVTPRTW